MVVLHDIADDEPWGVICHTCDNNWIARRYTLQARPGLHWRILDLRAAKLVRTGLLAAWLTRVTWVHREKYRPYEDRGDYTDSRGLMLILVAHHHHDRGFRITLTDDLWDAALVLAALGGPWAGARLLLDAAASTANPPAER